MTRAHHPSPPAVTPAHHPVPPVVTPARHPAPPAMPSAHHPAPPRGDIPAHHPVPPRALGGCSVPWGAVRLLLTGGTWAPIWGKFVPKWAEHPHLGSRLPPPQLGGALGWSGGFCSPGKQPCSLRSLPRSAGKYIPARFLQHLQGSAGSPHTLASVPGEPLPEGKEKEPQKQSLGTWIPSRWGSPRAGAALAGSGGQENNFFPPTSHCWDFSHLGTPGKLGFRQALLREMFIPTPPFQQGKGAGAWDRAAKATP